MITATGRLTNCSHFAISTHESFGAMSDKPYHKILLDTGYKLGAVQKYLHFPLMR